LLPVDEKLAAALAISSLDWYLFMDECLEVLGLILLYVVSAIFLAASSLFNTMVVICLDREEF
jgi:hypothetical protein